MKRHDRLSSGAFGLRASADRRIARLRRTIAAECELLGNPIFAVGAAHVIVDARAEIRRLEGRRTA
jgi:hypothetical protein